jgi:tRNA (cytidine56-2'-O)-methyltransferase
VDENRKIIVLRLGHRPFRDKRVTSHVGLVARAFGADGLLLTVEDEGLLRSLEDVKDRWGGEFFVKVVSNWRGYLRRWRGSVVHLTMYGSPVYDKINEIRTLESDILVIVGAEKVPPDAYKRAQYNISISTQPHSEVSALAIFLDRFFSGEELKKDFKGRTRIQPSGGGKKLIVE